MVGYNNLESRKSRNTMSMNENLEQRKRRRSISSKNDNIEIFFDNVEGR